MDRDLKELIRKFFPKDLKEAKELQLELTKKISIKKLDRPIKYIGGVDVSFKRGKALACIVIMSFPELELKEKVLQYDDVQFPYVPGYLSLREGPPIIRAYFKLKIKPDVLIFDGQGIAHPRHLGIATHVGVVLQHPTIGCAKSVLVGKYEGLKEAKGSSVPVYYKGEKIAYALRTRKGIKPVIVSPGNLIDFEQSVNIILKCSKRYRLPEPIRYAHSFSKDKLREID